MSEFLEIIHKVIAAHQLIRESEKRVGESTNDFEAFLSLQQASSSWSESSVSAIHEQKKKLQETVEILDGGLKNHFAFEEQSLPSIFGGALMRGLLVEHKEIKAKIEQANSTLNSTHFEELPAEELSAQKAHIQELIFGINKMLEEHAGTEEMILKLIERAL